VNGSLVVAPTTPRARPPDIPAAGSVLSISRGGFNWQSVDVQDYLQPGAENVITLRVLHASVGSMTRGLTARPYLYAAK